MHLREATVEDVFAGLPVVAKLSGQLLAHRLP